MPPAFQRWQIPKQTTLVNVLGLCLLHNRVDVGHVTRSWLIKAFPLAHVAAVKRVLLLGVHVVILAIWIIDETFLLEKVAPTGFSGFI